MKDAGRRLSFRSRTGIFYIIPSAFRRLISALIRHGRTSFRYS